MSQNDIEIRNVKKSFGSQVVHKNVNLDIHAGKITFIMGASGGGKSVLLKQIMGFIKPDSGSIKILGKDISIANRKELKNIRKSMGILFQGVALFDSWTVYENVAFPFREHTNKSEKEIEAEVIELLAKVNVHEEHLHKLPHMLSGGQRKRVGLARAVALRPQVMLYDEPTTGLDPLTTQIVDDLIRTARDKFKLTTIVVSHDIYAAFRIAERVAFLIDGEIIVFESMEELFNTQDKKCRDFFGLDLSHNKDILKKMLWYKY